MGKGIEERSSVLHHARENKEEGSDKLEKLDASHMSAFPGFQSGPGDGYGETNFKTTPSLIFPRWLLIYAKCIVERLMIQNMSANSLEEVHWCIMGKLLTELHCRVKKKLDLK